MNSTDNRNEWVTRTMRMLHFLCAVSVYAMLQGCAPDHRISMGEFLESTKHFEEQEEKRITTPVNVPEATVQRSISPYRVGPGDTLSVTLNGIDLGVPSPVRVRVNRTGQIILPTVGAIKVAGMELEDVEVAIQRAFVPSVVRDMVAIVDLENFYSTHVLVHGAVANPGLVPLRRTESNLLFAIASAGGVSQVASGRVTLKRVNKPMGAQEFQLTDPRELERALAIDPLEDGDIIEVEAAEPNTVYVGGLVNVVGPQTYPSGVRLSYLQVLAAAGGPRTDIFPKWGTLIRRMPDGKDMQVKLDLGRLAAGSDENFRMSAGDILWIPHTFATRAQEWFNRNIFFRAGAAANVSYNVSGIEYMNRASQQSGGNNNNSLEDSFDPYGFLRRNTLLQNIQPR